MSLPAIDIDPALTTHVVLTRFAVRRRPNAPIPDPDWLTRRCELFERYCLPSMQAQTVQDFAWILLFDSDIDQVARARLEQYERDFDRIRFRPAQHFDDVAAVSQAVTREIRPGSARLITTRLDNDDMVSNDHIERIRRAAAQIPLAEKAVLIFTSGFELAGDRLYWRPFPRSPFASLVEPVGPDGPTTIMSAEHESVDDLGPVIELGSPAAWTQVVHGDNILNRVRGIRVPNSRLARSFTMRDDRPLEPDTWLGLCVGVPASAIRLVRDVLGNPRYLRKVADLLSPRRR